MRHQYYSFQRSLFQIGQVQTDYLQRLLAENSNTEYGRKYGFSGIDSIKEYQNKVPLSKYCDYTEYIELIAQGQKGILTHDRVRMFEPSSGSTSASKMIPYNKALKKEFNRAISPWLYSMYHNNPQLLDGKAYWSISPAMDKPEKKGELKVGFDEDSDYLGFWGRSLYNQISAVDSSLANEYDLETFRNKTLARLLLCEELSLISIWNPTFLTLLLDHLLQNKEKVLSEAIKLCRDKQNSRLDKLKDMLSDISEKQGLQGIWPNLTMISCWKDGMCQFYANQLSEYFPDTETQGKGLIATEAFVSLPFLPGRDPVLAVNSHFFEFIDEANGQIYLADELVVGKTYSVIVSTGGGLYRYQLEDIVEITGFIDLSPTMRFISKSGHISDMMGEKLHERHVKDCFKQAFKKYNMQPEFFLLTPIKNENSGVRYCIFLQDRSLTQKKVDDFLLDFDTMLRENFHYDYCRKLGQIDNPALFQISSDGLNTYHKEMLTRNIGQGDIKPMCLDHHSNWDQLFSGAYYTITEE